MTLIDLHAACARALAASPELATCPVVLSVDSEGNEGRALEDLDPSGWFQPLEEQPALGDLPSADDADPARDQRCVILWPKV
jgi:hypothetical protein